VAFTHKQLKEAQERWREVEKAGKEGIAGAAEQSREMREFMKDYCLAPIQGLGAGGEFIKEARHVVYAFLQTQEALVACNFARWACFWAAAAATLSLFCAVAAWLTVYVCILALKI